MPLVFPHRAKLFRLDTNFAAVGQKRGRVKPVLFFIPLPVHEQLFHAALETVDGQRVHVHRPCDIAVALAPVAGTEQQAQDLIRFIDQAEAEQGIWETNIFGKTVEQLVDDGITTKVASIGEESQLKLQDTMQKIVNDSNGGMVCIII